MDAERVENDQIDLIVAQYDGQMTLDGGESTITVKVDQVRAVVISA